MGAPTALAAVTASARRRGLPQHRGQTRNQQSGGAPAKSADDSGRYLLQKTAHIRHGKRHENHTVVTSVDDPGGRHLDDRGAFSMFTDETRHMPCETLADPEGEPGGNV